jgi:curli biogenesis system outer membrane secretion channel CsgG
MRTRPALRPARWFALMACASAGCATVHEPVVADAGAAGAAAFSPTLEQQGQRVLKRKVAVLRFSNETKYGTGAFGGAYGVPIEEQAADILKTRLIESGKVVLIDAEGFTGEEELKRLKADYAIVGSVSEFGRRTSSETGVFSRTKKQVAYAAVNLRLIETQTGKAIFAEEGAGQAEVEAGRVFGVGQDAGYDSTLNDKAISDAISKLISNILERMLDAPWQTGLVAIEGDSIMIAGGDAQGLRPGDVLAVKKRGRIVTDPQYGGELELPREEVARIEVVSFFGSGVDGQGSVCRLTRGSLAELDLAELVVEEVQ